MKSKITSQDNIMYIRNEKLVDATDNWYPNYPGDKISISISLQYSQMVPDGTYRGGVYVRASGADDDFMCLEYHQDHAFLEDLQNKYRYWEENVYNKIPDKVNHKWFEEHGFSNF